MAAERLRTSDNRHAGERLILSVAALSLSLPNEAGPNAVLSGIDLSVEAGEFVVIFGPSGAGKSTLLRAIAGLLPLSSGEVQFNPRHLKSERPFGFVFQEPRLLPWRRVAKNVGLGLERTGIDREERGKRTRDALALVGLADHSERWPHQLSGGQRQRVGIARALAVRPDILLMDEPFSSLDVVTRRYLQIELLRIWSATRTSILFVTHDLEEAMLLADRLILLAGAPGRLLREYPIGGRRPRNPSSPAFRSLLREIRRDLDRVSGSSRLESLPVGPAGGSISHREEAIRNR